MVTFMLQHILSQAPELTEKLLKKEKMKKMNRKMDLILSYLFNNLMI